LDDEKIDIIKSKNFLKKEIWLSAQNIHKLNTNNDNIHGLRDRTISLVATFRALNIKNLASIPSPAT
jgi:hypothetical protein